MFLTLLALFCVPASCFEYAKSCGKNEVLFLHECFCEPGWESSSKEVLDCSVPNLVVGNCECEPNDLSRSFLKNLSWAHPLGYRCQALCRWNSQVGVPRSLPTEWYDNQKWKQLPFYTKDLPRARHTHLKERLKEFAVAFDHWDYLNNTDLGHVIEFGAGGYTQTRNILEHTNVSISSVTLIDPQVYDYIKIAGCTYKSGVFEVNNKKYTTYLNNSTVEKFGVAQRAQGLINPYDTVIMMNVLVYSLDAFQFLETLHYSLKIGGLLLFHDRYFKDIITSSKCITAGFFTNVLQVHKAVLDHFLSFYSQEPYLSTDQTEGQRMRGKDWCHNLDDERGYWAAVRKLRD
mmetsp:Transcript_37748/g.65240  ORF Transcript_37748/g.65240 Transcript_37748/m.65240 type:complete len:346 (-) Transcript_37748:82-1119(-)